MTDQPDALPDDFAAALRELRSGGDPRFVATLIAANRAGWSQNSLGTALGITSNRISQIIKVGPGGHDPIPGIPPGPMPEHRRRLRPANDPDLLARQKAAREAAAEKDRKAAVRWSRSEEIRAERVAEAEYRDLCWRLAIEPVTSRKGLQRPPTGQRWYRCRRCGEMILRSATRPDAHAYPTCLTKR